MVVVVVVVVVISVCIIGGGIVFIVQLCAAFLYHTTNRTFDTHCSITMAELNFELPETMPAGAEVRNNCILWFEPFGRDRWHPNARSAFDSILQETYRRARGVQLSELNGERGPRVTAVANMDGNFYRVAMTHRSDEPIWRVTEGRLYIAHRGLIAILIPPDVAEGIPIVHLSTCRRGYVETPFCFERVETDMPCAMCGLSQAESRCSGCNAIYYCSARCQQRHWPQHKRACKWWRETSERL